MGQVWKTEGEESVEKGNSQSKIKRVRRGILVRFHNHQITSEIAAAEPSVECCQQGCSSSEMASTSLEKSGDDGTSGPAFEMVVIVHSGH